MKLIGGRFPAASQGRRPPTMSRKARRAAEAEGKKNWKKAVEVMFQQTTECPGLLMDTALRRWLQEFNQRLLKSGPETLPSSFNVLEAFCEFDEQLLIFRPRKERNHVFSWVDFIDFVTSETAVTDESLIFASIPEGQVLSYNAYDDPHDLMFSIGTAREYGVGGVSFVRHGSEVSILLAAGEYGDLDKFGAAAPVFDEDEVDAHPGRESIKPAADLVREAVPLSGHGDLWQTFALERFVVGEAQPSVRYVLKDAGQSYVVLTDDDTAVGTSSKADRERWRNELREYGALFELGRTALSLPAYFRFKVDLVRDETCEPPAPGKPRREDATQERAAPPDERVRYRRVSALRVVNPQQRTARRFTAPQYRVEVGGFWRELKPHQSGRGPNGEIVEGRTWVREHERWRENPSRPIEVLVKSRVAIAKQIAAAEAVLRSTTPQSHTLEPASEMAEATTASTSVDREVAYRERRLLTTRLRWKILQRDDFRCALCGADAARTPGVKLEVDHILPVARGGKTTPENLLTLCSNCNNGKGALM